MKAFLIALAAAMVLTAVGSPALAQPKEPPKAPADDKKKPAEKRYAIEVVVLHATNSKRGIDKRIERMPELKKPPFSSYDSYELLMKRSLPISEDEAKTLELPNERVLRATLLDILPESRFRISASINAPGGKDFLPLLKVKAKLAQRFIVAGQSYKRGILVLVIRIVTA